MKKIIIDEVSMMGKNMMHLIDQRLHQAQHSFWYGFGKITTVSTGYEKDNNR